MARDSIWCLSVRDGKMQSRVGWVSPCLYFHLYLPAGNNLEGPSSLSNSSQEILVMVVLIFSCCLGLAELSIYVASKNIASKNLYVR